MEVGAGRLGAEHGAVGGDVRVAAANAVVDALRGVDVDGELGVVGVRRVGLGEVLGDGGLLVRGLAVVVGEAAGGGEVLGRAAEVDVHDAFGSVDCLVGVEHGGAHGRDVRATG